MTNHPAKSRSFDSILLGTGALALAFCLSAGAYAQEQQDQQQGPPPQSQDPQSQPIYAPQDADKPPYSHDRPRQNAPDKQDQREQQAEPAAPQGQPLPATLTVPAGTILVTRINEFLSTDRNKIGDQFTATLENPIVVNGWVVARRGQTIVGKVKEVRRAGRVKGTSELGVELTDLSVVDGRQLPILTELWKGQPSAREPALLRASALSS